MTERRTITDAAWNRWYVREQCGTCTECIAIAAPGHVLCSVCLQERADILEADLARPAGERYVPDGVNARTIQRRLYQRGRRVERNAAGLCLSCDQQAVPGQRQCVLHRELNRQRSRKI